MRQLVLALLGVLIATPAWAGPYLGDFPVTTTVYCFWNTTTAAGASVTRATNGTVSVYKDGVSTTEVTTGVTDTEDFDSLTGVHLAKIVTTDAFYAAGSSFDIVLSAATIDGQTVNAHLCSFSMERKVAPPIIFAGTSIVKGSTSVILTVEINGTNGKPLTGLTSASTGLTGEYCRSDQGNAACTAISIVSATRGTFTSGGFIEKDTTAGSYEVHVPNAAVATGADRVIVTLSGVAGMVPTVIPIELVDVGIATIATVLGTPANTSLANDIVGLTQTAAGTYRKNVGSQRTHPIFMRSASSTQEGKTGLSVALTVSKDGGAFAAVTGSVAEVANGFYSYAPSQADLNCDSCLFKATGSGAVPTGFWIFTIP